MPANSLTGSSLSSTYTQLLHCGTGTLAAGFTVRLGDGTASPLTISSTGLNFAGKVSANQFFARSGEPGTNGVNTNGYAFSSGGDVDGGMYSTADGLIQFYSNALERLAIGGDGTIRPGSNGLQSLGTTAYRWSQLFAATTTISTSDARQKQQIRPLSEAETAVAIALKPMLRAFKFNDAVAAKGDDARIHIGIIAQEVVAAFAAEGLDASNYALLCYDEWDAVPERLNEDGTVSSPAIAAGNAYGIRYEQLLAFMLAAL